MFCFPHPTEEWTGLLTSEWKRKDWNELFLSNLFVNKKQMNSYLNRVSNEQQFLDANNFRHLADLGEQTTGTSLSLFEKNSLTNFAKTRS